MRLFVSIDLPGTLTDAVAAVQAELAPAAGIRLVDPDQVHLTLKFLGDVDPADVGEVTACLEAAVDRAGVGPFTTTVEGLGVFPDPAYIRVVWLGVGEGSSAITALFEAVEAELVGRGFDPADHAFTPHLTIARMDHAGGKDLVQRLVDGRHPSIGQMPVGDIRLTESTLTPDGPVYETVERFPLPDG